ncbi:type IV secretion system effector BspA [Ochrobactrum sp. 19YEA23]|uniref:type IV secretion system effector BspA n=1 Tax=Ochrobactrum sp. 19YEA23 TaxID=3039854 RepID=UPI00247A4D93
MLFQRRHPLTRRERLRLMVWPRRSFSRSFKYGGKRILRITASPHAVAAGLAVGVFSAFTPFFGFHLIIAIVLAYFLAGNIAAAAIGTTLANPLTLPFIWGSTFELGRFIMNGSVDSAPPVHLGRALETMHFDEIWTPLLKPMLFGSTILGAACAVLVYFVTRYAVSVFRRRRLERLAEKHKLHSERGLQQI